jgi:hypothetical protein
MSVINEVKAIPLAQLRAAYQAGGAELSIGGEGNRTGNVSGLRAGWGRWCRQRVQPALPRGGGRG